MTTSPNLLVCLTTTRFEESKYLNVSQLNIFNYVFVNGKLQKIERKEKFLENTAAGNFKYFI